MSDSAPKNPPRLKDRIESICTEMIDRGIFYTEAVEQFQKCFILEVVRRNDGSISHAADELGIHRNTLAKRLDSYRARTRGR